MSDAIGRFLEDQYGMARNRLGDFSATSPMNRESTNVEDRRGERMGRLDTLLANAGDVLMTMKDGFDAVTTPKVDYEQWIANMQAIGDLLPKDEIAPMPGTVAHRVPFMKRGASLRAEGGRVNRSPEDRHADQAWLDEEARQNHAANPAPVEWGVMPSVAGPFGDALSSFLQSAPSLPFSSMPQDHQRRALQTAATLLMMGESPISEMFAQGKADGGATLSPGPEPSGRDKVFDAVYGFLGGKPENRWAADKITDVATLGGMAPWTAAYDGGKELAQTGRPASLATAILPGARVAAPVAKAAEKAVEKGIRAFHGSPHDFDRFDISRIGTGEGAQAYGSGLYFAENEAVAKSYRDALKKDAKLNSATDRFRHIQIDGRPLSEKYDIDTAYVDELKQLIAGGDQNAIKSFLSGKHDRWQGLSSDKTYPFQDYARDKLRAYENLIGRIEAGGRLEDIGAGRMYEVNINASPDDFLDWDKPLSQQSEKVRAALDGIDRPMFGAWKESGAWPHVKGESLYRDMAGGLTRGATAEGKHGMASNALREAGIPGIRYLDQGSRGAGDGSRNYVVFDDAIIDIVRKYGIAGLLAAIYGGSSDAEAAIPPK